MAKFLDKFIKPKIVCPYCDQELKKKTQRKTKVVDYIYEQ